MARFAGFSATLFRGVFSYTPVWLVAKLVLEVRHGSLIPPAKVELYSSEQHAVAARDEADRNEIAVAHGSPFQDGR